MSSVSVQRVPELMSTPLAVALPQSYQSTCATVDFGPDSSLGRDDV